MPSRRVIVLDRQVSKETQFGNQSPQVWKVAFWADVPAARATFYANVTFTSAFQNIAASDLTALRNGTVTERVRDFTVDKGSTIPQLQAQLEAAWTLYQTEVTAFNPWNRYGTFWDGTSWTAAGAA